MPTRLDDDQDTKLDPVDSHYRNKLNSTSSSLSAREKAVLGGIERGYSSASAEPSAENRNIEKVRRGEETPSANWANKVTGQGPAQVKVSGKKGPAGLIALLLGGGLFGIITFLAPASLLVNLKENYVNRYDTQNTSMSIRLNKVIVNKISRTATSGCRVVKIACRFTLPSNRFLNNLAQNGVTALDDVGNVIERRPLGFNKRPASYEFIDNTGKKIPVRASEFASTLAENPTFRAAFHKAFNPRWIGYADSIATRVLGKFGSSKSNKVASNADADKAAETLNAESAGEPNAASEGAASSADDAARGAQEMLEEAAEKEIKDMAEKTKKIGGDPILAVGLVACLGLNTPGFVTKVVRAYQMRQLIKYGLVFMVVADAIKAGDATPEQVAVVGTILTSVYKDSQGNTVNGSALDSFGVKNALFGDTSSTGFKKDYGNFIPGGKVSSFFGPSAGFASNPTLQQSCSLIASPQAQVTVSTVEAGITAASAGTGGVLIAALRVGLKTVAAIGAIDYIVDKMIETGVVGSIVGLIPLGPIADFFLGDLTKDIQGEDVGNALTSGVAHYMGQTANAGGNVPLSKGQAIAYNNLTNQVNLAYAEEDRATLSPLDPSSPNTFVGSIVSQIMPYVSELSNASGTMSFFGNILGRSVGAIVSKASAASSANLEASYSMCPDSNISSTDVAAGPFCNIIYGIPAEYINEDTADVLAAVSDQVDEDTGEPKEDSDLSQWISDCTGGDTTGAAGCKITERKYAEYALYTIDHRIQVAMDEDLDAAEGGSTVAPPEDTTPSASTSKAELYSDSTEVACSAGTIDAGTDVGYNNGNPVNIRLCSIPNTIDRNNNSRPMRVNSRVSGAYLGLTTAMASYMGTTKISVADSFRTMAGQRAAFARYGSPRAARPGYSNHQMGLAIDFQLSTGNNGATKRRGTDRVFDWLTDNAGHYGIGQYAREAWHWQPVGLN